MYKKYALAVAIEVVVPSKINSLVLSSIPKGKSFAANFSERNAAAPYATIPIKGRGIPAKPAQLISRFSCKYNPEFVLITIFVPDKFFLV